MTASSPIPKITFPDYEYWVDCQPVWELRDAANLYLGFFPEKGGTYYEFNDLLAKHEQGIILVDSETAWPVALLKDSKPKVEWNDIFTDRGENKISLELFVKRKTALGEIKPVFCDGLEDRPYFHPKEITAFFQRNFLNTPPQDLLNALGFRHKQKPQIISEAELKRSYKVHIKASTEKQIIPNWKDDQTAMTIALGKKPTDRQIKQIRAELAPIDWKAKGRKPRK